MGQFKGYEPKQRGIPTGRYSRHLVRTNALVQDANCMTPPAPVAPPVPTGRIGWALQAGTPGQFAVTNAGTATVSSSSVVLYFSLLAAPSPAGFAVTLLNNSANGVLVYNAATGLGTYTIPLTSFGNAQVGTATLQLTSGGVPQGNLGVTVLDSATTQTGYDGAQWIAFSPV